MRLRNYSWRSNWHTGDAQLLVRAEDKQMNHCTVLVIDHIILLTPHMSGNLYLALDLHTLFGSFGVLKKVIKFHDFALGNKQGELISKVPSHYPGHLMGDLREHSSAGLIDDFDECARHHYYQRSVRCQSKVKDLRWLVPS